MASPPEQGTASFWRRRQLGPQLALDGDPKRGETARSIEALCPDDAVAFGRMWDDFQPMLEEYLAEASRIFERATPGELEPEKLSLTGDFEHLRWFPLPGELRV